MELITILLSGLLGALAPIGLITDRVAASNIRERIESAETLAVRIDNAPSYQLLQGKVERVRIAGRGVVLRPDLRLAALELETDAIAFDPASLRQGFQLEEPLQAGVRLEITEADANQFLQSAMVKARLQKVSLNLPGNANQQAEAYSIKTVQVDFLEGDRLKFLVTLQGKQSGTESQITAESGLGISAGRQLQLIEPKVMLGNADVPGEIITLLTAGLLQQLDLSRLDESGLTARVLNFKVDDQQLDLATFVRVEPRLLSN
jgi:hypothetical protein